MQEVANLQALLREKFEKPPTNNASVNISFKFPCGKNRTFSFDENATMKVCLCSQHMYMHLLYNAFRVAWLLSVIVEPAVVKSQCYLGWTCLAWQFVPGNNDMLVGSFASGTLIMINLFTI